MTLSSWQHREAKLILDRTSWTKAHLFFGAGYLAPFAVSTAGIVCSSI